MLIAPPKIHSLERILSRGRTLEIPYLGRDGRKTSRGMVEKLVAAVENFVAAVEKLVAAANNLVAAVKKLFAAVERKISRDSRKNSRSVQKVVAAWSKN